MAARRSLTKYRSKRDFARTPEPSGGARKSARAPRFVVHEHRASHLHYDFRLEMGGVLVSWAVPKGPTAVPGERRLAMQTEDHPLDYVDFEGIIPEGSYGAGEVIVWDEGSWELAGGGDPERALASGKIDFVLHGQKLRGRFLMVKMKTGAENAWLLFKRHDEYGDARWRIDDHPASVRTGRTIEDVAADASARTWQSDRPARSKALRHAARVGRKAPRISRGAPLPTSVQPELATLVDAPFDDQGWIYELKWDGIRAVVAVHEDGRVEATSRNGLDLLPRFPELARVAEAFAERPVIVDGEIVVLDAKGRSSFQALQRHARPVTYVVFDVLYAQGRDLRGEPLDQRKRVLAEILPAPTDMVLPSGYVVGEGKRLFELVRRQGVEGVVAKRRASTYVGKRTRDWLKFKVQLTQDAVVGGWTSPEGSRTGFGSLLLGAYDGGELAYVGHVGTGFGGATLSSLRKELDRLATRASPFQSPLPRNHEGRAHWVRPRLVVTVGFTEWTADGKMRHPTFLGLRDDKRPGDCVIERPLRHETRKSPGAKAKHG